MHLLFQKQNMTSSLIRSSFCLYHMPFPGFLKVNSPTCLMGEFDLDFFLHYIVPIGFNIYCSSITIDILPVQLCLCTYSFYDNIWLLAWIYYRLPFIVYSTFSTFGVQKVIFASCLSSILWNYPWKSSDFPWKVLEFFYGNCVATLFRALFLYEHKHIGRFPNLH